MLENCSKNAQSALKIGDLTLRNRAFLAPMSGVSDVPFRQLAWEFGAGMVVSEMVASEALITGQEEMRLKAEAAGLPIHIVQLAGRQPKWMAQATKMAEQAGAHAIDINMGCPSKRVTNGYSGSALMRDLDHAMTLIDAVMGATDLPVTLKMRLGWDDQSINAPELAERAVAGGVKLITVHARTRNQFYKGQADWTKVRSVRERIDVPLVINGDIESVRSARKAMDISGADGVMIGRATYGAPWLPGQIGASLEEQLAQAAPSGAVLADIVTRHYEAILSLYGVELGMRNARKHLDWYSIGLRGVEDYQTLRRLLMTSRDVNEVVATIGRLFTQDIAPKAAA
ncbi:MAG: tRNA dihydrouridine synthase DusB [Rhizobiaceae bacterium]|nr:tRNA dihydrouridine synthase DusB [Rhizobiaceae bacterium]